MARPLTIAPRPSGNVKLPWVVHIPEPDRPRYEGQKRRYFAKEGQASAFAKTLRRHRTEHTAAFNNLPDVQKADAHQAIELLSVYPSARSLSDLAREEVARLDVAARSKALRPLIDEMLAEKKADGRRERYLTGLRGMLGVFEKTFPERLASSFTSQEISKWLRDKYANPNSRDSYRRNLGVLFSWAKQKGFVAVNPVMETKAVSARREDEVAILTPSQLTNLLNAASPRLQPYIVLCAFAALRPGECQRLRWDHIKPQGIYVPKAATKTVARFVPILPNLTIWLEFFGPHGGKVFPRGYRTWRRDFEACRRKAGLFDDWDQDSLRHSAISYWLAIEPNRDAVAKYSGNSAAVQQRDYDNPRSPEEAAAWYAVLPETLNAQPAEATDEAQA